MVQHDVSDLDSNGYIINMPDGTVDLRTGKLKPHDPENYCTKLTAVSPGGDGMDEWLAFLGKFTQGDKALEDYLQVESGMEIISEVLSENAVLETGPGGNAKATYNFAKFRILGDYAGTLPAEIFTMN